MNNEQVLAIIETLGVTVPIAITTLHHKGVITTQQAVDLLGLHNA